MNTRKINRDVRSSEICCNISFLFIGWESQGTHFIGFTFRSSIDFIELALEVSEFSEIILNLHLKDVFLAHFVSTILRMFHGLMHSQV
mmetsp:Transcript_19689/g.40530  ORF Transcript_19689/g.40530 Transcript_19689/m.40530 type:complete len:88 (+) Transcript_19689:57-320(+)